MAAVTIVTTRFNENTWQENCEYRRRQPDVGCVYGFTKHTPSRIAANSLMYVIEMNNDTNNIEGIGLVRNLPTHYCASRLVYEAGPYNRLLFEGKYRVDRSVLVASCPDVVQHLEIMLFTGKTHLKRGRAVTRITEKMFSLYPAFSEAEIKERITNVFRSLPKK
jgi:hypothetical protein